MILQVECSRDAAKAGLQEPSGSLEALDGTGRGLPGVGLEEGCRF